MVNQTNSQKNKGILKVLKYSYSLTIVIIIIVLFVLGNFLYNNVYQTLGYAKIVTNLKKQVASEYLEKDKFNTVIDNINKKAIPYVIDLSNLHNPFN